VLLGALVAVQIASHAFGLGGESLAAVAHWSSRAVMVAAAAAVALRVVRVQEHRAAWGLIAAGLVAWTAGDLYYYLVLSGGPITYPSPSDALYLVQFAALIAGMRLLRGRTPISLSLIVVLLGIATAWSWLVFSEVVADAAGGTAAVATTVAFPVLDLLLVVSSLLALSARGWRTDRVFMALAVGFLLMVVADSVYAAQVAAGTYRDGTLVESTWPAGALCIAAAAWMKSRPPEVKPDAGDRVIDVLTRAAIVVAVAVLFVDHWSRVDTVTVVLSGITLFTAVLQRAAINGERAEARRAADAAEALRDASAEAALDCIVSIDGEGCVSEWNDAAIRTFGYPREVALGSDLAYLIIPPEHRAQHKRGLAHVARTGEGRVLDTQIEVMALHADGREFPVELMITQVRADPPLFTGFLRDISDRRRREEENELLAAIVRSADNAIISKNLNGVVTAWNKGAEHLYGYAAEEAVGRRLTELIVPDGHSDQIASLTDDVLAGRSAVLETQRRCKNGEMVDVSLRAFPVRDVLGEIVGVCTSAQDITERRRQEARERQDKEGRLWRGHIETALADGHFMFWGQPVVDVNTGVTHHHELLLRMDLEGNVITPNHFLPHAESSDLINEIDRFAVSTGFEIAASVPVAINLSAKSLQDPRLLPHIKERLGDGAIARNVTFEITETAAVENLEAAREFVEELRTLGFGVALDDFGTGYGSFTYLKHLPVTQLKIDIDFVRGLAQDPTDQRLVKSIISVARHFDMKTVAEGVEDEATLGLLRDLGVDFVQGYHIGYPTQMTISGRWKGTGVELLDQALTQRLGDRGSTVGDPILLVDVAEVSRDGRGAEE
jgi:PAS domain S-box-containing protein